MKVETAQAKLAALLGLTDMLEEHKKKEATRIGKVVGYTEDEIQAFREQQGLIYYLQAPKLFQAKVCGHCGEHYLVSRLYVAYCSYTCIRKELQKYGIDWRKGDDINTLVGTVYEGNEPIWIRNLDALEKALQTLVDSRSTLPSTYQSTKSGNQETTS